MASASLKKRGVKKLASEYSASDSEEIVSKKNPSYKVDSGTFQHHVLASTAITLVAGFLRFRKIDWPDQVVFDEVHFGKFASYYLEGTYFFDLHPPFAKMLIAFVGFLCGYDGKFKFDSIGDPYAATDAPYVAYRAFSAIQGTITVPLLYWTLQTLKFTPPACLLAAAIVAFDTAHTIDSRLILLDATLIVSVAFTVFAYAKFLTYRKQPFSTWWWIWLYNTGFGLSATISTKYVGVLTYVMVGIAVLHELWILLDYKKGLSIDEFMYHFFARAWALVAVPFMIYLFWFYLHFSLLTTLGPGDAFMSSEFVDTLQEAPDSQQLRILQYYDQITFEHKVTGCLLHSHDHVYPLRYEDGRVSSNTQQVTCVVEGDESTLLGDANNWWEIVPPNDSDKTRAHKVFTEDVVRLRHVGTGGYLWTHDVASPLRATNEEFTIAHGDQAEEKYQETLFKLKSIDNSKKNKRVEVKTLSTQLRLVHVDTVVAMWSHDDELLPDWGFNHQEISGNKKIGDSENTWKVSSIANLEASDPRAKFIPKVVTSLAFFRKWWELQILMFEHNNKLSLEHPFASQPDAWPLAVLGVSFWNDNPSRRQIFFVGNVVGFWIEVACLAIYVGLLLADQILRRRAVYILTDRARLRLYNTLGFLFLGWATHYLPFFLMGRQKFLHHYLPAHLIAALFLGGLLEFLCLNNSRVDGQVKTKKLTFLVGGIVIGLAWFFWFFSPIVYGDVSLPVEEIKRRQWMDIKLHYNL